MDQLSQKLNAQQIIRANGEAESEAMGVMRAQVREYQDCLDRMKTVADELGGLQQTIAALPDLGSGVSDSALDGLKEEMVSMNKANEDYLKQLQSDLLAGQNDLITRQQDLAQSQSDLMNRQSQMLESRNNDLIERLEAIKASNDERLEKLGSELAVAGNDDLGARLDSLEAQIGSLFADLKQDLNLRLDSEKAFNEENFENLREGLKEGLASDDNDELGVRLDRLEAQIGSQLTDLKQGLGTDIENRLNGLKQGLGADFDDKLTDLKQGLSADMESGFGGLGQDLGSQIGQVRSANEESLSRMSSELASSSSDGDVVELIEVLRDEVSAMKLQMENVRSNNDQYLQTMQSNLRKGQEQMLQAQNALSQTLGGADIHKECVRVYRNVQASVQDENGKQLDSIRQENTHLLEDIKIDGTKRLTAIRDENAKLLGSLRNDLGKQLESIREENAKLLVSVKTETSKIEEQAKSVRKLAIIAIIASVISIAAPFIAAILL